MKTPEVYVAGNQFYYVCLKLSFFYFMQYPAGLFSGAWFFLLSQSTDIYNATAYYRTIIHKNKVFKNK